MGRIPKIRVSYRSDSVFLLNLCRAIEADEKRSNEWKRQVLHHMNQVITLFARAEDELSPVKAKSNGG